MKACFANLFKKGARGWSLKPMIETLDTLLQYLTGGTYVRGKTRTLLLRSSVRQCVEHTVSTRIIPAIFGQTNLSSNPSSEALVHQEVVSIFSQPIPIVNGIIPGVKPTTNHAIQ